MIQHNKPTIEKDDIKSIADVLNSKWVAPGKKAKEFENELTKYISTEGKTIAVNNGTVALHLALLLLDIKKGDEVILPTYVCIAVLNAINYTGATPILTDINPYDFNISFNDTKKKITTKTKAIIVPHMYGIPADIDKFLELDVPIIEDCAQSIGAKFNGQKVGIFGDISIFSFYASKLLTTGNGGAVFSKNKGLIDFVYDLVDFDCRSTYKTRYNYHLSDLQASLGLSQLKKLEKFIKRRKEIASEYNEIIEKKNSCYTVEIPKNKENVWYRYVIISKEKTKIKEKLLKEGINVINPLEKWELLHNYLQINKKEFPNSEKICKETISIPIYPSLANEEIRKIRKAIEKVY